MAMANKQGGQLNLLSFSCLLLCVKCTPHSNTDLYLLRNNNRQSP